MIQARRVLRGHKNSKRLGHYSIPEHSLLIEIIMSTEKLLRGSLSRSLIGIGRKKVTHVKKEDESEQPIQDPEEEKPGDKSPEVKDHDNNENKEESDSHHEDSKDSDEDERETKNESKFDSNAELPNETEKAVGLKEDTLESNDQDEIEVNIEEKKNEEKTTKKKKKKKKKKAGSPSDSDSSSSDTRDKLKKALEYVKSKNQENKELQEKVDSLQAVASEYDILQSEIAEKQKTDEAVRLTIEEWTALRDAARTKAIVQLPHEKMVYSQMF